MHEAVNRALFILYVSDQERSRDFYSAALGVEATLDVPGMTEFPLMDQGSLGLMPEAGVVRLLGGAIPDPALASGVPRAEVYLMVDEPARFHERALACGAREISPLLERDWGHLAAYSLDPDGHVLAFACPVDGVPRTDRGSLIPEAAVNVRRAYDRWSDSYDQDQNLTRDLDGQVLRSALAELADGRGENPLVLENPRVLEILEILEIGCGTGKNTDFLAGIGAHVLALDFSEGMLAKARDTVRSGNVTFQAADITRPWPCADGSIDLIACDLVLEHIENLDFVFAQAGRVLAPGGRLFISELHPCRQYQGGRAHFQHDGATVEIPAFVHHLSDFLTAAERAGLQPAWLREFWHEQDQGQPPRIVSFLFEKGQGECRGAPEAGDTR